MKNRFDSIQNTSANLDISQDWRNISFKNKNATIRIGTSFSGIGALEFAFKRLGVKTEILFAGDTDNDCKKTYLANYHLDESRWHDDIYNFNATRFHNQVDLFVGGAPCQAFSMRGKRGGFDDTRGTLFREFARVVMECRPKVFIFENVRGLLNHDKGKTWKTIKETFENDCNYQIYFQVLNGKDYGVPQSRERLFCVGFKNETYFKYPSPIPLEKCMYDYLQKRVSIKYLLKAKGVNFITREINHKKAYTQINGNIALCQKRNQQFNWHGDFVFHPVSNTIRTVLDEYVFKVNDYESDYYYNESASNYAVDLLDTDKLELCQNKSNLLKSQGLFRKLSPMECLRLMGFTDDFKIEVSDTSIYRQAGNSIIVDVLMAILKQMDITVYAE